MPLANSVFLSFHGTDHGSDSPQISPSGVGAESSLQFSGSRGLSKLVFLTTRSARRREKRKKRCVHAYLSFHPGSGSQRARFYFSPAEITQLETVTPSRRGGRLSGKRDSVGQSGMSYIYVGSISG